MNTFEKMESYIRSIPSQMTQIKDDNIWVLCGGTIDTYKRGKNKGKNKYIYHNNNIDKNKLCVDLYGLSYDDIRYNRFSMVKAVLTENGKVAIGKSNSGRDFNNTVIYGCYLITLFRKFNLETILTKVKDSYKVDIVNDYIEIVFLIEEWIKLLNEKDIKYNVVDDYNDYYFMDKEEKLNYFQNNFVI